MAAGKKYNKELDPSWQSVEINMTPMIDCTFLLLIFFMVVSEMAALDMENVSLPYADQARDHPPPADRMLTVNIRRDDALDGHVRIAGEKYDKEKLAELIRKEAIRSELETDRGNARLRCYKLSVLIRCDRDAKYETVQWVFDACSRNGVYKTILAASPSTE